MRYQFSLIQEPRTQCPELCREVVFLGEGWNLHAKLLKSLSNGGVRQDVIFDDIIPGEALDRERARKTKSLSFIRMWRQCFGTYRCCFRETDRVISVMELSVSMGSNLLSAFRIVIIENSLSATALDEIEI